MRLAGGIEKHSRLWHAYREATPWPLTLSGTSVCHPDR